MDSQLANTLECIGYESRLPGYTLNDLAPRNPTRRGAANPGRVKARPFAIEARCHRGLRCCGQGGRIKRSPYQAAAPARRSGAGQAAQHPRLNSRPWTASTISAPLPPEDSVIEHIVQEFQAYHAQRRVKALADGDEGILLCCSSESAHATIKERRPSGVTREAGSARSILEPGAAFSRRRRRAIGGHSELGKRLPGVYWQPSQPHTTIGPEGQ
jgi:hypothetical protein